MKKLNSRSRNLWKHKITGQTGLWQYIIDEGVIPPSQTYTFIGILHRFDNNGEWVVMRYAIGERTEHPTKQDVEEYYNHTLLPLFNQLIR